ncbi:hypothetical protein [Aureimonas leprariae]|uniref:hypothetical protein n=1 Tax=Plantimonas leprariae TaxID=2615207 RepID=UPI00138705F9|nr:hypothetical protein [Aureimonas leprariae]
MPRLAGRSIGNPANSAGVRVSLVTFDAMLRRGRLAFALFPFAAVLAGCGYGPYDYGRTPVAPTRVDPVRLGAPPSLDPGITRRAGSYIRPSGPYINRPAYRAPRF